MKKKIILFNCLLCAFVSCNNSVHKKQEQEPEKIYYSQKIQLSQDVLRPSMFCVIDSLIIIMDNNKSTDPLFYVFNLAAGNIHSEFGFIGSGPNDFNFPVQMNFDGQKNEIRIFDQSYSKLYCYDLKDIIGGGINPAYQLKAPIEASRIVFQNDSLGYCLGVFYTDGMIGKCVNGIITKTYLNFPDIKNETLNPAQKFGLFQGNITINKDKTKFVYTSARCDLIKIISIEHDTVKEIMTHNTYSPKFRREDSDFFAILPENPNGYISVSVSSDYIFALFSGRNEKEYGNSYHFGESVHLFDWDGNLIKKIALDKDAWQIFIDEKSNKLYSIHFEMNESNMEAQYYAYDIKYLMNMK